MTSDQLQSTIDAKLALLNTIIATLVDIVANPKPDYSIDGQSVSWTNYQSMLFEAQKKEIECLDMLIELQNKVNPFQFVSQGI